MNKKIIGSILTLSLATMAIGISGCDDETTDQYHTQEVQAQLAKIQAVSGTYSGTITSLDGNTPMGGIQFTIEPSTTTVSSNDQTTMTSQAGVTGTVTVMGSVPSPASFAGGYDSDTGIVSGTITVPTTGGNNQIFTIESGLISGGTFSGQIQASNYPQDGGKFVMQLNGPLPSSSGLSAKGSGLPSAPYYTGTASDPTCRTITNGQSIQSGTCSVSLSIQDDTTTVADSFVDFFIRTNNVILNLIESNTLEDSLPQTVAQAAPMQLSFGGTSASSSAQFDQRTGRLIGQETMSNNSGAIVSLQCREVPVNGNSNGSIGWSCTLSGSMNGGEQTFSVSPAATPLR